MMKTAVIIVRVLTGLLYSASALMFFFNMMPQQEMSGATLQFVTGLAVSGYFMPLLKSLELVCGIALITGRFVSLAAIVLFPITVNIFLFHAFLAPDDMLIPVLLIAANLFLAFAYRERYKPILSA